MVLKIIFGGAAFILVIGLGIMMLWNGVISDLPIKGITFLPMKFELACNLSFSLLVFGTVQNFLARAITKFFAYE